MSDTSTLETTFLKNLWDDREAARLESQPLELLRYRSNLLGEGAVRRREHGPLDGRRG